LYKRIDLYVCRGDQRVERVREFKSIAPVERTGTVESTTGERPQQVCVDAVHVDAQRNRPHDELESTAYEWAQEILEKSPTSIRMLKFAMNLTDDGMVGQQVFAGEATRLAYMTDEAKEGRDAFLEKRKPNFPKRWIP
jgi:enoyl-CoA hydratase/carnithine racemase